MSLVRVHAEDRRHIPNFRLLRVHLMLPHLLLLPLREQICKVRQLTSRSDSVKGKRGDRLRFGAVDGLFSLAF